MARYSISRKNGSSDTSAGRSSQFTPRFSGKKRTFRNSPFHARLSSFPWPPIVASHSVKADLPSPAWPLGHAPLERHEASYESPTTRSKVPCPQRAWLPRTAGVRLRKIASRLQGCGS